MMERFFFFFSKKAKRVFIFVCRVLILSVWSFFFFFGLGGRKISFRLRT